MKYITKNRKFFNLDVTGLSEAGKVNEFGVPFIEVIRIHDLCIQGTSLDTIKNELQKILKSGRDINEYLNPFIEFEDREFYNLKPQSGEKIFIMTKYCM